MSAGDGAREFPHAWRAEVLRAAPMIVPARRFVYPRAVPGEEDALARGALEVMVHPATGGNFLATCALGFSDPSMPTGVFACPNAREMCAVAGGYAYVIDTEAPERVTQIGLRPVVEVRAFVEQGLILFAGFHTMVAWGVDGMVWETGKLTWEGLRITDVRTSEDGVARLYGLGWNLQTDKEVEFAVDLRTGEHTGGGF